eukprot:6655461-Lingulodinium_polyedra.AAC.1
MAPRACPVASSTGALGSKRVLLSLASAMSRWRPSFFHTAKRPTRASPVLRYSTMPLASMRRSSEA